MNKNKTKRTPALLRIIDQETARVVAIQNKEGEIVGAGCLVSGTHILTCYHVVECAVGRKPRKGDAIYAKLIGFSEEISIKASVEKLGKYDRYKRPADDMALIKLKQAIDIQEIAFATPLRHSGKRYSVLGFPEGDPQGRNASGLLHGADAVGLVQMDRGGALSVLGGFSGAPVWSSDVNAFVGLVVTELSHADVAWCIPSRLLCKFFPGLLVRFRVPPADRPQIHDYEVDDPNVQTYGTTNNNGHRQLTVKVRKNKDTERDDEFEAVAVYECLQGSPASRGGYVTIITHPSYTNEDEDAYELFGCLDANGRAEVIFYPDESFTVAAVGDGGDTALTFDLKQIKKKPHGFE